MLMLEGHPILPKDGHRAGRALLRDMTERHTGQPMPAIGLADRGKPYFEHSGLHFSITHTKGHVFCALSDRNIGIDAEELDRQVSPALAAKILSPGELLQYEASQDKPRALLTFWVLKEAHAKFTGKGLAGYPNHTNFSLDDPRVTEIQGCLVAVVQEDTYAF